MYKLIFLITISNKLNAKWFTRGDNQILRIYILPQKKPNQSPISARPFFC